MTVIGDLSKVRNRTYVSLATTVALPPQTRLVLLHLERNRTISPLEAFGVYGITRLAARIFELKKAGFQVVTTIHKDLMGKSYARYALVA